MEQEQVIERLKAEVLQEKRAELVKHNLSQYIPYLMSKYIIAPHEKEDILSLTNSRSKSDKIMDILLSRGPTAYDHLCNAMLDLRVEAFLVTKLNILLKRKCSAALGSQAPLHLTEEIDTTDLPTPSSVSQV